MIPVPAATLRTVFVATSPMYRFPALSSTAQVGWDSCAAVASTPLPDEPLVTVPATVVIIPMLLVVVVLLEHPKRPVASEAVASATPVILFARRLQEVRMINIPFDITINLTCASNDLRQASLE